MASKSETPALILSLLITLSLLMGGLWWSAGRLQWIHLSSIHRNRSSPVEPDTLQQRLSEGERLLVEAAILPEKQLGVEAIATGHPDQAITHLATSLAVNPNDPEALIYLNNARASREPTYTIAVAVPLGSDPNSALELLRGVAQAQQEVNQAGGIDGVLLRVRIANDDNNPAIAQQIASSFVQDSRILAVVGHADSDATLATANLYETGGLVAISPASTAVQLSGLGHYLFRTVPSDFVTARALAEYMLNQMRQQRAGVFYSSQSRYSQSLKAEFVTALSLGGGQAVREFDLSSPGFSPVESLNQVAMQGVSTLVLLPGSEQLDRALQVIQVNAGRFSLLAGNDVYAPKTLEIGGPEAVGMVVAVPWHILSDPQSGFVQTSRQLWWGDVNWRTATAYDATTALIAAIAQNPTRSGIQQALSAGTFYAPGATGVVRFLPSGDRNQGIQLVEVRPGFRSGFGFDFVPLGLNPATTAPEALGMVPSGGILNDSAIEAR